MAVFYDGSIRETAVIGFGGVNVTNDIALGLSTPAREAERIKKQYGCALQSLVQEDETISVSGIGGRPPREVPRKALVNIIEPRMEEIYTLVLRELKRSDYADVLGAGGGGVVVTGGGALLQGSPELAERVFGMPARLGAPKGVVGLTEMVSNPVHATGIGLILYGVENRTKGRRLSGDMDDDESIPRRMKEWFKRIWKAR
jgi:cell division protein FtsA